MKNLKTTRAWVLLCSILAVTGATFAEAGIRPPYLTATTIPWLTDPNNSPLSTSNQNPQPTKNSELSCISTNPNIINILQEAKTHCLGQDYLVTFYLKTKDKYIKLDSFMIDKHLFHNLLMKYSDWSLTSEKIGNNKENNKIKCSEVNDVKQADNYNKGQKQNSGIKYPSFINPINKDKNILSKDKINKYDYSIRKDAKYQQVDNVDYNINEPYSNEKHYTSVKPVYNSDYNYYEVNIPKYSHTSTPKMINVYLNKNIDENSNRKIMGNIVKNKNFDVHSEDRSSPDQIMSLGDSVKDDKISEIIDVLLNDDRTTPILFDCNGKDTDIVNSNVMHAHSSLDTEGYYEDMDDYIGADKIDQEPQVIDASHENYDRYINANTIVKNKDSSIVTVDIDGIKYHYYKIPKELDYQATKFEDEANVLNIVPVSSNNISYLINTNPKPKYSKITLNDVNNTPTTETKPNYQLKIAEDTTRSSEYISHESTKGDSLYETPYEEYNINQKPSVKLKAVPITNSQEPCYITENMPEFMYPENHSNKKINYGRFGIESPITNIGYENYHPEKVTYAYPDSGALYNKKNPSNAKHTTTVDNSEIPISNFILSRDPHLLEHIPHPIKLSKYDNQIPPLSLTQETNPIYQSLDIVTSTDTLPYETIAKTIETTPAVKIAQLNIPEADSSSSQIIYFPQPVDNTQKRKCILPIAGDYISPEKAEGIEITKLIPSYVPKLQAPINPFIHLNNIPSPIINSRITLTPPGHQKSSTLSGIPCSIASPILPTTSSSIPSYSKFSTLEVPLENWVRANFKPEIEAKTLPYLTPYQIPRKFIPVETTVPPIETYEKVSSTKPELNQYSTSTFCPLPTKNIKTLSVVTEPKDMNIIPSLRANVVLGTSLTDDNKYTIPINLPIIDSIGSIPFDNKQEEERNNYITVENYSKPTESLLSHIISHLSSAIPTVSSPTARSSLGKILQPASAPTIWRYLPTIQPVLSQYVRYPLVLPSDSTQIEPYPLSEISSKPQIALCTAAPENTYFELPQITKKVFPSHSPLVTNPITYFSNLNKIPNLQAIPSSINTMPYSLLPVAKDLFTYASPLTKNVQSLQQLAVTPITDNKLTSNSMIITPEPANSYAESFNKKHWITADVPPSLFKAVPLVNKASPVASPSTMTESPAVYYTSPLSNIKSLSPLLYPRIEPSLHTVGPNDTKYEQTTNADWVETTNTYNTLSSTTSVESYPSPLSNEISSLASPLTSPLSTPCLNTETPESSSKDTFLHLNTVSVPTETLLASPTASWNLPYVPHIQKSKHKLLLQMNEPYIDLSKYHQISEPVTTPLSPFILPRISPLLKPNLMKTNTLPTPLWPDNKYYQPCTWPSTSLKPIQPISEAISQSSIHIEPVLTAQLSNNEIISSKPISLLESLSTSFAKYLPLKITKPVTTSPLYNTFVDSKPITVSPCPITTPYTSLVSNIDNQQSPLSGTPFSIYNELPNLPLKHLDNISPSSKSLETVFYSPLINKIPQTPKYVTPIWSTPSLYKVPSVMNPITPLQIHLPSPLVTPLTMGHSDLEDKVQSIQTISPSTMSAVSYTNKPVDNYVYKMPLKSITSGISDLAPYETISEVSTSPIPPLHPHKIKPNSFIDPLLTAECSIPLKDSKTSPFLVQEYNSVYPVKSPSDVTFIESNPQAKQKKLEALPVSPNWITSTPLRAISPIPVSYIEESLSNAVESTPLPGAQKPQDSQLPYTDIRTLKWIDAITPAKIPSIATKGTAPLTSDFISPFPLNTIKMSPTLPFSQTKPSYEQTFTEKSYFTDTLPSLTTPISKTTVAVSPLQYADKISYTSIKDYAKSIVPNEIYSSENVPQLISPLQLPEATTEGYSYPKPSVLKKYTPKSNQWLSQIQTPAVTPPKVCSSWSLPIIPGPLVTYKSFPTDKSSVATVDSYEQLPFTSPFRKIANPAAEPIYSPTIQNPFDIPSTEIPKPSTQNRNLPLEILPSTQKYESFSVPSIPVSNAKYYTIPLLEINKLLENLSAPIVKPCTAPKLRTNAETFSTLAGTTEIPHSNLIQPCTTINLLPTTNSQSPCLDTVPISPISASLISACKPIYLPNLIQSPNKYTEEPIPSITTSSIPVTEPMYTMLNTENTVWISGPKSTEYASSPCQSYAEYVTSPAVPFIPCNTAPATSTKPLMTDTALPSILITSQAFTQSIPKPFHDMYVKPPLTKYTNPWQNGFVDETSKLSPVITPALLTPNLSSAIPKVTPLVTPVSPLFITPLQYPPIEPKNIPTLASHKYKKLPTYVNTPNNINNMEGKSLPLQSEIISETPPLELEQPMPIIHVESPIKIYSTPLRSRTSYPQNPQWQTTDPVSSNPAPNIMREPLSNSDITFPVNSYNNQHVSVHIPYSQYYAPCYKTVNLTPDSRVTPQTSSKLYHTYKRPSYKTSQYSSSSSSSSISYSTNQPFSTPLVSATNPFKASPCISTQDTSHPTSPVSLTPYTEQLLANSEILPSQSNLNSNYVTPSEAPILKLSENKLSPPHTKYYPSTCTTPTQLPCYETNNKYSEKSESPKTIQSSPLNYFGNLTPKPFKFSEIIGPLPKSSNTPYISALSSYNPPQPATNCSPLSESLPSTIFSPLNSVYPGSYQWFNYYSPATKITPSKSNFPTTATYSPTLTNMEELKPLPQNPFIPLQISPWQTFAAQPDYTSNGFSLTPESQLPKLSTELPSNKYLDTPLTSRSYSTKYPIPTTVTQGSMTPYYPLSYTKYIEPQYAESPLIVDPLEAKEPVKPIEQLPSSFYTSISTASPPMAIQKYETAQPLPKTNSLNPNYISNPVNIHHNLPITETSPIYALPAKENSKASIINPYSEYTNYFLNQQTPKSNKNIIENSPTYNKESFSKYSNQDALFTKPEKSKLKPYSEQATYVPYKPNSQDIYYYNNVIPILNNLKFTPLQNEMKTKLANCVNNNKNIKSVLCNSNVDVIIPLGNILIGRKDSSNSILYNINPEINLKMWPSTLKVLQARLELKFKDISINNFQPILQYNFNNRDLNEVKKIVTNYIKNKYGDVIVVNEDSYKSDEILNYCSNQNNKCNLLWPANSCSCGQSMKRFRSII